MARFEKLNAARMSAAGEGWTEPNLYFSSPLRRRKMQTNLASNYLCNQIPLTKCEDRILTKDAV